MRTSCNGCRVLRKGCTADCNIRPCIQWIDSPDSQANATLFLAKFYGRAGLLNLLNAGPQHLRPAIFKSLLYEACGRIVDPINGSVGLLYSGNWPNCQAAVEAVLQGSPITQIHHNPEAAASHIISPPRAAYDIRHASLDAQKVRTRTRSKRTRSKLDVAESSDARMQIVARDECRFSVETNQADLVKQQPVHPDWLQNIGNEIGDPEVGLELSLGLPYVFKAQEDGTINGSDDGGDMD